MDLRLGAELEEDHIAVFGADGGVDRLTEFRRHGFGERALHPLSALDLGAREPLGAHLHDVFFELLELLPAEGMFCRDADRFDDILREIEAIVTALKAFGDGLEHRDPAATMFDGERRQIGMREAEAKVGLIVPVFLHALREIEPRETAVGIALVKIDPKGVFIEAEDQPFERREELFLVDEGHLDIELRELGLTIDAEIFITEAADDLIITIVTRHHQHLLIELRALGERIKMRRIKPRRDEEIPRAAGGVFDEEGGLDLDEAAIAEEVTRGAIQLAPDAEVALELRA